MKIFKEFFEDQEQKVETVAVWPGGFKPPTKGHFAALEYLMQDADRGIVFIGRGRKGKGRLNREFITPEMAKSIWEIYSKYIGKPIDVIVSSRLGPVKDTYDFADNNKDIKIIVGVGAKDNPSRYDSFTNNVEKYPLVNVVQIPMQEKDEGTPEGGEGNYISGTKVGELFKADRFEEAIDYFVPDISIEDKEDIEEILRSN